MLITRPADKRQIHASLHYSELPQLSALTPEYNRTDSYNTDWHAGLWKREDVEATMAAGSHYQLAEADALRDRIAGTLDLSGLRQQQVLSCVGGSPCVGAYLAGAPESMFRQVDEDDHSGTPMRIFFGLVSSGGIDASDLAQRGAAILAFAQVIAMVRPVELIGVAAMGIKGQDVCFKIEMGTAPIDMSAMAALSHPGVQRRGLYSVAVHLAGGDHCSPHIDWPSVGEATLAGCEPGDVFFKSPYSNEIAAIRADPVKWVRDQLRIALKGEGAAFLGQSNDGE